MEEIYRFRTAEQLLGEYQELETQTIYFASPEQLNDPMEGLRDIVWNGDAIAWSNLFKHYIYCLHHVLTVASLAGQTYTLSSEHVPIFGRRDEYGSPEAQCIFDEIWRRICTELGIGELIDKIATIEHKIRFNELQWYLSTIHVKVLAKIKEVYVDRGYAPETERPTLPSLLNPSILANSNFFDLMPKLLQEEFYKKLSPGERDNFFETLFSVPNSMMTELLLAHKYDRSHNVPDSPSEANYRMFVLDFPEIYLNCIEKLLWPQWYAACFSRSYNNASMWGNYANGHRGVCLIFQTNDSDQGCSLPLKRIGRFNSRAGNSSGESWDFTAKCFHTVNYSEKPGEVDFFRSIGRLPVPTLMDLWYTDEAGHISECASHVNADMDYGSWRNSYWENFLRDIAIKTRDWQYEEEERLILYSLLENELNVRQRTLAYEFESLAGIIFGIRTSDAHKLHIMQIIERKSREIGRTDFKFYQARYSPIEGDIQRGEVDIQFV